MSKIDAGKKAIDALKQLWKDSPEAVEKVLKANKADVADVPNNLLSANKKNMDALQRAKLDAPTNEIPAYPANKGVTPQADFKMVGEPQTKDFTMVPEGSQVPAVRGNTLPDAPKTEALIPEVMNKVDDTMLPAVRGNTNPVPLNDVEEITGSNKLRNALGIGTALGVGGTTAVMMNQPQEAEGMGAVLPAVATAATQAVVNNAMAPKQELPRAPAVETPVQAPAPEQAVQQEQVEEAQYLKELKAAQDKQNNDDFIDNMLRAGTTIGAGIAGTQADYSGVDALQKQNVKGVQNVKDKMTADMDSKKLKKVQSELDDDKKLRDPASDVSKAFRQALAKLGVSHSEKTTAADAKAMGINIQNLLMHEKTIAASLAKDNNKSGAKDDKMVQSLRKELTSGEIGKLYNSYSTARRTKQMVEEFAKNPTGYSDYGTLMNSLKTLQGDASTVREAEMKLGMEAGSLSDKYKNIWSKAKNGQSLQPDQRADIVKAVSILSDISSKNYLNAAAPILKQSERLGFSSDELLNDGLSPNTEEKKAGPKETVGFKTKKAPGSLVKVGNQSFIVNADGMSGTEQ